jgi:hypothetical protein
MHYDASKAPDPMEWLELDESDRIDLVMAYHKHAKLPVGESERLHAMAHVIVESQAAMGDVTVVPATLDRLMREGLDRHDAIHAIGSVLMGIVFDAIKSPKGKKIDINAQYGRELAQLTAASWRSQ